MTTPRVRFAPSPTGYFHVGSARTALYNWLFARQQGGAFILRIEDTDVERNREEWVGSILSCLQWLGLFWDEGPYRQSEHRDHYRLAVDALLSGGHAYYCDCTREAVVARRGDPNAGYDGFCRDRSLASGPGRALRFKVEPGDPVVVHDVIRGDVVFERSSIDDFVIVKASGDPLFVLANTVDDIGMGITHVIRGEDLLPTTPKGLLLWQVLDGVVPQIAVGGGAGPVLGPRGAPVFAHLPMLVNEKRQKLSKRRDPVALEQYRAEGYLPEVMVGYLALLGWSPKGGRELVSVDELVASFRLEEVNHSPAYFDVAKLTHFNGEAIRSMPLEAFVDACMPWLGSKASGPSDIAIPPPPWPEGCFDLAAFRRIAPLVQTRVERLGDVASMVGFLFVDEVDYEESSWAKAIASNPYAAEILRSLAGSLPELEWKADLLKEAVEAAGKSCGLTLSKAQAPVRVALTGRTVGLPLFESMEILGRSATITRIENALARIERES